MLLRVFKKYVLPSSLAIGIFSAGMYFERTNILNSYKTLEKINMPALPIFGTVSAASPISAAPAQTISNSRISQIMKYGFPGLDNVRSYDDFVLSYDRRNRVAHWVFEHLTAENIKSKENVDRGKCEFKPDESIHEFFRYCLFHIHFKDNTLPSHNFNTNKIKLIQFSIYNSCGRK